MTSLVKIYVGSAILVALMLISGGCGYSNQSLYDEKISSVYVEMFDNQSFRRGIERPTTRAI